MLTVKNRKNTPQFILIWLWVGGIIQKSVRLLNHYISILLPLYQTYTPLPSNLSVDNVNCRELVFYEIVNCRKRERELVFMTLTVESSFL